MNIPYILLAATLIASGAWAQSASQPDPLRRGMERAHPHDSMLAALGTETLACLGRVSPRDYRVNAAGALERAFDGCTTRNSEALENIDALLGLQYSRQAQEEGVGERFRTVWQRGARLLPTALAAQCPTWELLHVIDAPTKERVAFFAAQEGAAGIGKEYHWYRISAPQCGTNGFCSVFQAVLCAAPFGNQLVVWTDPLSSTVIVDPVWWLSNDTPGDDDPPESNPFLYPDYVHKMSFFGAPPGARFASLRHEGEQCTRYDEISGKHYVHTLSAIECTPGWKCMAYCGP